MPGSRSERHGSKAAPRGDHCLDTLAWGHGSDRMWRNVVRASMEALRDSLTRLHHRQKHNEWEKHQRGRGWRLHHPLTLQEPLHLETSVVTSRSMIRSTVSVVSRLTSPVLGSKTGTVLRITFSDRTRSRSATTFSLGLVITTSLDHLRLMPWLKVVQLNTSWAAWPTHITAATLSPYTNTHHTHSGSLLESLATKIMLLLSASTCTHEKTD